MNFAAATLDKRTIAWLGCILLLVGGWISYQQLGRFEDPEFVIREAVISTPYPGALPTQVAEEVTDVIEGAMQQLQEVKEITSVSGMGLSRVKVEIDLPFARDRDQLEQVWDKLRRKVADAQRELPPGAGPPVVNDDFGDVYALFFAVTGDGYSLEQVRDYVEVLERELVLVPGVARVATLGAPQDAIYVELAASRAAQLGITLAQIDEALRRQNLISAAGDLIAGPQRIRISPQGQVDSVAAIGNIVLGAGGEQVIFLKDVADIGRGLVEPPQALVRYDGRPAIGLGVSNVAGGNVVEMGDAVRARLAALESQRPVGMELNVISYQSDSVRAAVDGFVWNLVAAVVIVVGVLVLFMGLRSALVVGIVLVLTVAGTLIAMNLDGIAMQRISLGALIIALGMLVDNAIVVTDGILVRLQRGEDRRQAAIDVVQATQWPLLGGTAVGILAFSAIGLSPTDMGEYAGSLFWVILYSMLLSWVLAVTITPLLCVVLLKVKLAAEADGTRQPVLDRYRALLRTLLRHRLGTGLALLALLAAGVVGFGFVTPGFMPESARPQFVVDIYLPQGTDIDITAAELAEIEQTVRTKPGVTHAASFVGQGGLRFMLTYSPEEPNSAYGQLLVDVDDFRRIDPLVAELQQELTAAHPDAAIKVWKFMLGRGGGKKIEAAFRGPDPAVLRRLADKAKGIMAADPGAVAVQDDWREKVPVLRPDVDPVAAQRAGVDITQVSAALNRVFSGERVGAYREGDTLVPIIARAPQAERDRAAALDNVQVYSPTAGRYVPVGQLVTATELQWVDAIVRREDRFPTIKAQADPEPGALSGPVLERLKPKVESIALPPGYTLEWHGEYKASREANAGLAVSAPYGFAAMVLAVVVMFNAVRQPLVIWLTVPLAIVGVAIGLLLFQVPFEFMAILGFLSLIGMLVKNAIVLVDQADAERRAGKPGLAPVLDAAASRARPVVLGALTTILGVAPLLFDPFFKSMAVTIMFGLAFATLLTLIVVPLLYAVLFRIRDHATT
jgi:multidrug efflux pump subunit AcrB